MISLINRRAKADIEPQTNSLALTLQYFNEIYNDTFSKYKITTPFKIPKT